MKVRKLPGRPGICCRELRSHTMRPIRFRLLIATAAVLLGTALAQSQTATDAPAPKPMHAHGDWGRGHGHMGFFAKSLNLTDDQKAQMKTIMQKERSEERRVGKEGRSRWSPYH